MKVWVDITAPAHVLVFRPLIALMRERGDEVEVTARDYAQTVQLLEQHGIEAELIGHHGGRSARGKLGTMVTRSSHPPLGAGPQFDVAPWRTAPTT